MHCVKLWGYVYSNEVEGEDDIARVFWRDT
jgi:hypothetical protein